MLKGVTADVDEAVRSNFAQTLQVLAQVASIEEVELPELPYEEITRTILFAEAASAFEEFIESGQAAELTAPEDHYGPYVRTGSAGEGLYPRPALARHHRQTDGRRPRWL